MNAPISAALLQLRAGTPPAPKRTQPTIPAHVHLLRFGYEHDGLWVDLYGIRDAHGYDVQHVAVHRAKDLVDIGVAFSPEQLRQMSDWCDRNLPSAHSLGLVSQQEAAAERILWAKNSGWPPP